MPGLRARWRRADPLATLRRRPITGHRIIFFHAPKCGGTSVDNVLQNSFGLLRAFTRKGIVHVDAHQTRRAAETAGLALPAYREKVLLKATRDPGTLYIGGHVPYTLKLEDSPDHGWEYMTLLREPESRFLSAYHYNASKSTQEHFGTDLSLEAFLDTPRAMQNGANYAAFFGGNPTLYSEQPELLHTAEIVRQAKDNLERFAILGILNDLNRFQTAIDRRFGTRMEIPHLNRNTADRYAKFADLPKSVQAQIENACAPDREIYDHVCRCIDNR
jgi:hypothetical protein